MLSKTKQIYDDKFKLKYGEAKGCTVSELISIENELGLNIPEALKEYLVWGGKHSQGPLIGTDCFSSDLIENTKYLPNFINENSLSILDRDDYIVFYCHQGYVLAWVYASDGDNPEVYYFSEGTTESIAKEKSIDEWFYKDLSGLHGNCN